MVLKQKRATIGKFSQRIDAEHAVNKLKEVLAEISIVAKYADSQTEVHHVGMRNFTIDGDEQQATTGMIVGSVLGALVGCLTGLGMLVVPGVAFVVAVGTTGTTLATTLAGTGIGLVSGGLISVVSRLGMTAQTRVAEGDTQQDEFLVIVHGTDEEVRWAELILSQSRSTKVWVC